MYGYIASMQALPGQRAAVVEILTRGAGELEIHGCRSYVVSLSASDEDTIWVFETWLTKEHHAASLQLPGTKAAIAEAMPMLTGDFITQELDVVGGLGAIPEA